MRQGRKREQLSFEFWIENVVHSLDIYDEKVK